MKKLGLMFILAIVVFSFGVQAFAQSQECPDSSDVVKRGVALANAPVVKLSDAVMAPALFSGRTVRIEGIVERNCTERGCWMEIAPKIGAQGVRVTFKDNGFYIPLNSKGMKATAEGVFSVETLSKEEATHIESEGARLKHNADGTATEVSFVAAGVELRK